MPKSLLLLRIFNTVITVVISAFVGFLSFAFYLGNRETHELLKQHLAKNFILRFGAFALLGVVLGILPILINLLLAWRMSLPMANAYRFALKVVTISAIAALGGTAVFFSH